MTAVALVGMQWGDEGKGKVTDLLAEKADLVLRYQGGDNAGHTIVVKGEEFRLHLLPSGILYPHVFCVLGNGVVINPRVLLAEMAELAKRGVDLSRLRVSDRAHVILPYHLLNDQLTEKTNSFFIGTTGRGIGPAYAEKFLRYHAIRIHDLLDPIGFREKLRVILEEKNNFLQRFYNHPGLNFEEVYREYTGYGEQLRPLVTDTGLLVYETIKAGGKVLFEGAQGTLLDIDHGTFPFVSSSNPGAAGISSGAGIGPTMVNSVLGVIKAYTTRVGEGPLPTELSSEAAAQLRDGRGREYGVTTGRPRRCGWFDGVAARYAVRINGITGLVVTKLDVLDKMEKIKICTAYRYQGRDITEFPADLKVLAGCEPVYREISGWQRDTSHSRRLTDLPKEARTYLDLLSTLTGTPITMISVGWNREDTIIVKPVWEKE